MQIPFIKMNGLGNDFVIIDRRSQDYPLSEKVVEKLADRRTGIGCDQLITMEKAENGADFMMRVFNADGGEVGACGNGARCVSAFFMDESDCSEVKVNTISGVIEAAKNDGVVSVNMGKPRTSWQQIPLAQEVDTLSVPVDVDGLNNPTAVNMGNPHLVFFVDDIDLIDWVDIGKNLEKHKLFPERTNVEFCQIMTRKHIKMFVWERGVGVTQACGSGACASVVAGVRHGLISNECEVEMMGGSLFINYDEQDGVWMSGPTEINFNGNINI